jgi:hypothetical protein
MVILSRLMRTIWRPLVAVAAGMLTVLIGMAPASAAAGGTTVASVPAGSAFTIRSSAANKCVGLADGGSTANGTRLGRV